MVDMNHLPLLYRTEDLYGILEERRDRNEEGEVLDPKILSIQTYYEKMWMDRGLNIRYQKFRLPRNGELTEPEIEIELDEYRSYKRDKRSGAERHV
jgi:tRNA (guanine-N7-)-methyltransferase